MAGDLFGFLDDHVGVAVLPLFHVFGLSSVLNVCVRFDGTLVLIPRFEPGAVIDAIERHRCTIFSGVPTMYSGLLQADISGRDLSALRVGVAGGAAIAGEVIRAFEEKFPGVIILEGYRLSETASTTTFNVSAEQRKVLSIGKPIWGVEVRVVDEDGKPLPPGPGNVGEIVIRGHNVMTSYYKNPDATAAAFRGGWFHTGDSPMPTTATCLWPTDEGPSNPGGPVGVACSYAKRSSAPPGRRRSMIRDGVNFPANSAGRLTPERIMIRCQPQARAGR